MSYISPIKIGCAAEPEEGWIDKIGKYMAGEVDNLVLQSCVKVGCRVDKDELEKALRYDRDQYEKGYEDGKRDAADAIEELQAQLMYATDAAKEIAEKVPKRGEWVEAETAWRCSICEAESPHTYPICPYCGSIMRTSLYDSEK